MVYNHTDLSLTGTMHVNKNTDTNKHNKAGNKDLGILTAFAIKVSVFNLISLKIQSSCQAVVAYTFISSNCTS